MSASPMGLKAALIAVGCAPDKVDELVDAIMKYI